MTKQKKKVKRRTKAEIEQDKQFEKDVEELLIWDDKICKWIKKVEKAEKEVGWKEDKLYNKKGELISETAKYNLKNSNLKKNKLKKIN